MEIQVTTKDIKKEARFSTKSPTLESAKDDFEIQPPTSG